MVEITTDDIDKFIRKNGKKIIKTIIIDFLLSLNSKPENNVLFSNLKLNVVPKTSKLEAQIEKLKVKKVKK